MGLIMKKIILVGLCALLFATGCSKKQDKNTAAVNENQRGTLASLVNKGSKTAAESQEAVEDDFVRDSRLCDMAAKYGFKVGACVSYQLANRSGYTRLLANDYNTTTATNEFKAYSLLNQQKSIQEGKPCMNYAQADAIAKMAKEKGLGIRGHVLVWDAYMSEWFFRKDFKNDGAIVSKQELEERLEYYIDQVITHFETEFPGLVYCWDVVNEAVADGSNEWIPGNEFHIRATRSGTVNMFNQILGPDYVKFAFECARKTVNKVNPEIKLFYNDYNTFYQDKRDAIIKLIKYLNSEEKLCDGVGMQGYIGGYGQQAGCMNYNDLSLIKTAIKMYSDLGIEVQLTEVAVRNYEEGQMDMHAAFYGSLFRTIISACNEGANFTGITIWGITDNPNMPKNDYSYKMNGPYCGLYTSVYDIKDSYKEVYKVLSEVVF